MTLDAQFSPSKQLLLFVRLFCDCWLLTSLRLFLHFTFRCISNIATQPQRLHKWWFCAIGCWNPRNLYHHRGLWQVLQRGMVRSVGVSIIYAARVGLSMKWITPCATRRARGCGTCWFDGGSTTPFPFVSRCSSSKIVVVVVARSVFECWLMWKWLKVSPVLVRLPLR